MTSPENCIPYECTKSIWDLKKLLKIKNRGWIVFEIVSNVQVFVNESLNLIAIYWFIFIKLRKLFWVSRLPFSQSQFINKCSYEKKKWTIDANRPVCKISILQNILYTTHLLSAFKEVGTCCEFYCQLSSRDDWNQVCNTQLHHWVHFTVVSLGSICDRANLF